MDLQKTREDEGDKVETLKLSPVFRDLSLSGAAGFAFHLTPRFCQKGALLFSEGDPTDYLYILHDGLVRVYKPSRSGRSLTLAILTRGDVVGIPAPSERRYRMSAESKTDVVALRVTKKRFFEYVTRHPKVAIGLINLLAERYGRECDRNADSVSERIETRVLDCLCILVGKFGGRLPVTRRELADYAGTTTETAIRVLSRLKEEGLVKNAEKQGEILVPDPVMLQKYRTPSARTDRLYLVSLLPAAADGERP